MELLPGSVAPKDGENQGEGEKMWQKERPKIQGIVTMGELAEGSRLGQGRKLAMLRDRGMRDEDSLDSKYHKARELEGSCCGCNTLNPESNLRICWDIFLVILLLYVAHIVPVRLAFGQEVLMGSLVFWFETMVDVIFAIDIVLNFRTAIMVVGETGHPQRIDDRGTIAKHYVRGWFMIDIVAVLPYSYLELLQDTDDSKHKSGSTQQIFKALRLVRLAKLLRLTKMLPLLRKLDDKFDGLLSSFKLLSVILVVTYFTHLVGCLWYAVGSGNDTLDDGQIVLGWVGSQEWGPGVSVYFRWLRSFYWAMTTLTTVGYGDISPSTQTEMVFGILAELCGTVVFGTLVGTVGSILQERRRLEARHDSEISELKEFMTAKNLPLELQVKVRRYMALLFKNKRAFDEKAIMDRLPPSLSFEMMKFLYGNKITNVPLFKELPEEVLYELCQMLLPYPAAKGDLIYRIGDPARECFIVNSGEVIVTSCKDDGTMIEAEIYLHDKDARVFERNTVFGEDALDFEDLIELRRTKNAISAKDAQLSMLRVSAVEHLAKTYPIIKERIQHLRKLRSVGKVQSSWREHQVKVEHDAAVTHTHTGHHDSDPGGTSRELPHPHPHDGAALERRILEGVAKMIEGQNAAIFRKLEAMDSQIDMLAGHAQAT